MRVYIIIIVISFFFFGCEQEKIININIDQNNNNLVLYSFFHEEDSIKLQIFKSVSVLYSESMYDYNVNEFVNNATIYLYDNDTFIDSLTEPKHYFYLSNLVAHHGHNYKVKVVVPGFESIEAECKIPEPVKINSVKAFGAFENLEAVKFNITFTDPNLVENFYILKVKVISYNNDYAGRALFYNIDPLYGNNVDFDILNSFDNNKLKKISSLVFSDELINGSTHDLTISLIKDRLGIGSDDYITDKDSIIFELNSIDKDLYEFLKTRELYNKVETAKNLEPINVFSNIQNGHGIFCGYSSSTDTIVVNP